jgi:hypothetical protein
MTLLLLAALRYTYALDSTRAVQSIKLTNTDGSHETFVLAITLLQQ